MNGMHIMGFIDDVVQEWSEQMPELDAQALLVVGKLAILAKRMETRLAERLDGVGLNLTDFDILVTLRRSGAPFTLRPSELSQKVVLTSGGMTAALTRLQANGFIKREKADLDGRSKPVALTEEGRDLAERAIALRMQEARKMTDLLAASDAIAINRTFDKWVSALDGLEQDLDLAV